MHPIYKEPEHFKFPAILAMHIQVKDAKFLKYKKPKTYKVNVLAQQNNSLHGQ